MIGETAQHALAGCRGILLLFHRMPNGSVQVVGTHRTFPSVMTNQKADVVEYPKAFAHVGLLVNKPPGSARLLFI